MREKARIADRVGSSATGQDRRIGVCDYGAGRLLSRTLPDSLISFLLPDTVRFQRPVRNPYADDGDAKYDDNAPFEATLLPAPGEGNAEAAGWKRV